MANTERVWFSDSLKLKSEHFATLNIDGAEVEIRKHLIGDMIVFTAYAQLEGSQHLSEKYLGYPTLKEGNIVGVDTGHSFNLHQTEAGKLMSALNQISFCIKYWKEATQ